ncbi:ubiquitin-specific protease [Plasmopara halstedii]|uniref:Ubiquitin carboxyl-terminal hydrolase n=1 Tax=Plasmopara halstedii TaxID=4781 RepID=A0A0P1AKK5_PLAHL|nr:ubiquitin-specific protease [Plasmopara halstedii]CEG41380.1 ubiquitin-specific protease [Plasmopara halstedii]|eukprot:XP_024577749.1 ubiquitin-specific protease [Plasmopara halstedii]
MLATSRASELTQAPSKLSSSPSSAFQSTRSPLKCEKSSQDETATCRVNGLLPFKAQCKSAVALVNERRIDFVRAKNVRIIGQVDGKFKENRVQKEEKREITSVEAVEKVLAWHQSRKIGPGFANLGNTCYLNSVLQCLTYTPCFAQLLLDKEMSTSFGTSSSKFHKVGHHGTHGNNFCSVRAMSRLLQLVHGNNTVRVLQPKEMVMNIRHVSKTFRIGRQEDSHEFFRLLLDSMQRSCLRRAQIKSESHVAASTTFVHRIFGGKLKNCLKCAKCGFVSERYDDFLDLSLEVASGVNSIIGALRHFTATEKLDDYNAWKCSQCGQRSRAEKGLSIAKCPNVLMIQLKRFDVMSGKIKRHIEFPQMLDIAIGMSKNCDDLHRKRTKYELHAVLVHAGYSTDCGHYFAFVKGSSGQWYEMNDDSVRWVRLETVLQQKAYMLFYSRVLPMSERIKTKEEIKENTQLSRPKTSQNVVLKTDVRTVTELDMKGFLASLKTPVVPSTPATDRALVTSDTICNTQQETVETFRVSQVESGRNDDAERNQYFISPSFTGRLGRISRFHPALWTKCPQLGMNHSVAEMSDATNVTPSEMSAPSVATPVAPIKMSSCSRVPFDPQHLKNVGVRSAALFGRTVDKWTGETDVESSETTSDEAVDKTLAVQHDRVLNALKQEEWKQRNTRRLDYWNETLDVGKMKKVKKRKEFVPNQGRANVFQKTLMRQKDEVKRQRTV